MPLRDEFLAATFTDAKQLDHLENTLSEIGFPMPVSALKEEGWNLEPPEVLALMEKLRKVGTPLGEYVKGRFYCGIKTGLNEVFVIDKQTRERLIAEDPKSEELIKPWLRGRDIKIMYAEIATEGKFLIDDKGYYSDTTSYIMANDSLYLLGVLNSKLFTYMFSKTSSEIRGGFFRWKRQYMEQLSIFTATDKQKNVIIDCTEKIIANPDSPDVPRIEKEIDKLIYNLYSLTPEEIAIVEGKR